VRLTSFFIPFGLTAKLAILGVFAACLLDFFFNVLVARSELDRGYKSAELLQIKSRTDERLVIQRVAEWTGARNENKPSAPQIFLDAIISERGGIKAIIRTETTSSSSTARMKVGVGDRAGDWEIVELNRFSVVAKGPSGEKRLTLFRPSAGVP
jgi:hypothetical protein